MKISWSAATALVSILAAGDMHAASAATRAALPPQALSALARERSKLLGSGFDLVPGSVSRDRAGVSHARVQQTYHGIPMWGAQAMLHIASDGSSSMTASTLVGHDLGLDTNPKVAPERALKAALTRLAPAAPMEQTPNPKLVLFPTVHSPRLKFTTSLEEGKVVRRLDTEHSSLGRTTDQGDWALAYHIHTEVSDRKEGPRHTDYIVDARSGEIVEIWDSLRADQAPKPVASKQTLGELPTFINAKGVGHSQYSGDVTLDALDDTANSGTFIMQDTLRSFDISALAPGTANISTGDYGLTVYNLAGSGFEFPAGQRIKFTNPAGTWGDGLLWNGDYTDYTGVNSETVAVDALHGAELYWDMLFNVFGFRGLDGVNQGLAMRVHLQGLRTFWNPARHGVDVADFPQFAWLDGTETPAQSMAQPEVIAHELTHGLIESFPALDGRGETAAVEESLSDSFSALSKFYAGGAGAKGSVIPDTDGSPSGQDAWTFGLQVLGNGSNLFYPIRSMAKPQADGLSPSAWFHGVSNLEPHFSSGIGNRAFYFLSQGAGPYTGPDDAIASSAYVPGGFPGIGNQKAASLYAEAIVAQLPSTADYRVLRLAVTFAAFNQFGPDSPEYAAVENAFAAVNVGAAHGQAARPLVTLQANSANPLEQIIDDTTVGIAPLRVQSKPFTATVAHAADPSVTWTAPEGGVIQQDGTYLPPNLPGYVLPLEVRSQADPMEFALGFAAVLNPDVNDDNEFDAADAVDLGGELTRPKFNQSANIWPDDLLNDDDIRALREIFSLVFTH